MAKYWIEKVEMWKPEEKGLPELEYTPNNTDNNESTDFLKTLLNT